MAGIFALGKIGYLSDPGSTTAHTHTPTPLSTPTTAPARRAFYALYAPSGYPAADHCLPGPTVVPTRTSPPVGRELWWDEDPALLDPDDDHIGQRGLPLHSPAFDPLTEAGGCVQAWLILREGAAPSDTTAIHGVSHARTRVTNAGLTEVYLRRGDTLYIVASGNVNVRDLATALHAAVSLR